MVRQFMSDEQVYDYLERGWQLVNLRRSVMLVRPDLVELFLRKEAIVDRVMNMQGDIQRNGDLSSSNYIERKEDEIRKLMKSIVSINRKIERAGGGFIVKAW